MKTAPTPATKTITMIMVSLSDLFTVHRCQVCVCIFKRHIHHFWQGRQAKAGKFVQGTSSGGSHFKGVVGGIYIFRQSDRLEENNRIEGREKKYSDW